MTDLQTIFAKDPLEHTREDRDEIVRALREQRKNFNMTGAVKTKEKIEPGSVKINLKDLGL